jgi:ribonuclease VapC
MVANAPHRFMSAIAIYETTVALMRVNLWSADVASDLVTEFMRDADVMTAMFPKARQERPREAFERFGKGRGHPAQLNMGDCFAYAVATHYRVPLLFKGDDFGRTDIEIA